MNVEEAKEKVKVIMDFKFKTFLGLENLAEALQFVDIYGNEDKLEGNRWAYFERATRNWNSLIRNDLLKVLEQLPRTSTHPSDGSGPWATVAPQKTTARFATVVTKSKSGQIRLF